MRPPSLDGWMVHHEARGEDLLTRCRSRGGRSWTAWALRAPSTERGGAPHGAQYLISVWHDDAYEVDFSADDTQRRVAQVGAFNGELQEAGAWVFAAGLHPASSVRPSCEGVSMTDGPCAETKEQMGGFWVIEATDLCRLRVT